MLNQNVGKNLKKLRKLNNFSQEEVQRRLDISRSTLVKIEKGEGRIDLDRLCLFSELYKVEHTTIMTMPAEEVNFEQILNHDSTTAEVVAPKNEHTDLAFFKEKIQRLKKEVRHLEEELMLSKERIKDKDTIIRLLTKKKN